MPKVLLNYKIDKKTKKIILKYDDVVFVDSPICVADYDTEYEDPVLAPVPNSFPIAMERDEFTKLLEKQQQEFEKRKAEMEKNNEKIFRFKINPDNTLTEVGDNEPCDIEKILPKDTKVEELNYLNGDVVRVRYRESDESTEPTEENHK